MEIVRLVGMVAPHVNVEAVSTTYCSLRRVRAINSHSEGSSSTINIFMMDIRFIGKDMKPILERI